MLVTRKFRIFPTKEQKKLFSNYFGATRYFYNKCVAQQREKDNTAYTHADFRKKCLKPFKLIDDKDNEAWTKRIPYNTCDLAIKEFAGNFKACRTKLARKQIDHFDMQFRKKDSKKQHFWIDDRAISLTFMGLEIFKHLKVGPIKMPRSSRNQLSDLLDPKCDQLTHDSQIQYENGRYYLISQFDVINERKCDKPNDVIALDPGVRTFLTGYCEDGIAEIGKRNHELIKRYYDKIAYLKEIAKTKKSQTKRHLRYRICKLKTKVCNFVEEFQYQAASWLTTNFGCIILPNYRTSEMVRKDAHLPKSTRKAMLALSFYKFSQKLAWLSSVKGCQLIRCSEAFTTKTCGKCGHETDVGASKKYICEECGYEADRDWNAARNIMIRAFTCYFNKNRRRINSVKSKALRRKVKAL